MSPSDTVDLSIGEAQASCFLSSFIFEQLKLAGQAPHLYCSCETKSSYISPESKEEWVDATALGRYGKGTLAAQSSRIIRVWYHPLRASLREFPIDCNMHNLYLKFSISPVGKSDRKHKTPPPPTASLEGLTPGSSFALQSFIPGFL